MSVLYVRGPDGKFYPIESLKGIPGSDANVTAENVTKALGYTPADNEDVERLTEEIADKQPKGDYALKSEIPAPYTLPTASADVKGGVKIGEGLEMNGDVLGVVPDGEWELIEAATLTEEISAFERTQYPDGTPYNLDAIKVIVQAAPGTTAGAWFPTGYDKNGKNIVGATGHINPISSGSIEWYRTSLVFNATPLYGFYDCWTANGSQGSAMDISMSSGAQYQTQTTKAKIAKIKLGLYEGSLAKGSSFEIWGVRANA